MRLIRGWCFHPDAALRSLAVTVDGTAHPVAALGMPRGDVFARMYPQSDPQGNSAASGFWGWVPLGPAGSEVELGLAAELRGGGRATASLGRTELVDRRETETGEPAGASVAIAMATFDPDPELFRAQIESIRSQSETDWVCVISDDLSRPDRWEQIEEIAGADPRFRLHRGEHRLGFYGNFERALSLVPPDAELIALSDQDDRWHPDKLARLRDALAGGATLAYSDMRVVEPDGTVVSETYWTSRPTGTERLDELLIANTVSGAASMFQAKLLDAALPFPQRFEDSFHDQWLAAVALAQGEIAFVSEPLYDYVQHPGNVLGHRESELELGAGGRRARWRRQRHPGGARTRANLGLRRWERIYFEQVARMTVNARTLEARLGASLSGRRSRELGRLGRLDSLRGLAWLGGHRVSHPAGRSPTMGNESNLIKALLWRRLMSARRGMRRKPAAAALAGAGAGATNSVDLIEMIRGKLEPLNIAVDSEAPERVNVLVPFVDLDHFFAGYIGIFNLARRLAERGARVRIVSVDVPANPLPADWLERVEKYEGLAEIGGLVEFEGAGDRDRPLAVSAEDNFIAMSCWAAHLAHGACEQIGRERFLFLIQEYEPFFHPMSSLAALTAAAYEHPHTALFSSELLRGYFREERIGVYEADAETGDGLSTSFENAMTAVSPPSAEQMATVPPRLLFYARPESHAARNMYELGHLALAELIEEGRIGEEWELYGIGSKESGSIELAEGRSLRLISRLGQDEYAEVLGSCSVGLALMLTPHPSLVPLEMAAAGLLTVTNSFANKTPERLAALSENLLAAEPTVAGVKAALVRAIERSGDHEARVRGAAVDWARNWSQALPDELLERVERLLAIRESAARR